MEMNVALKARVLLYFIILDGYMLCFKKERPKDVIASYSHKACLLQSLSLYARN